MILFICTGNTCRSPLAAALARSRGIDAVSAGIMVYPGSPATPEAVRAAKRHGADLTQHQAQPVTEELLKKADQVWVMTPDHWDALNARPGAAAFGRNVRIVGVLALVWVAVSAFFTVRTWIEKNK